MHAQQQWGVQPQASEAGAPLSAWSPCKFKPLSTFSSTACCPPHLLLRGPPLSKGCLVLCSEDPLPREHAQHVVQQAPHHALQPAHGATNG